MPYVRFVVAHNDPDSQKRQGLFQAISDLEHDAVLLEHEQREYDEVYQWFRQNLKKPSSFSRSSKTHAKSVAISWFKDTANEHIRKIRQLCHILESHDVPTQMILTERPGYVVYEDAFQIVAEPFCETEA